jgi:hypothetical protein
MFRNFLKFFLLSKLFGGGGGSRRGGIGCFGLIILIVVIYLAYRFING